MYCIFDIAPADFLEDKLGEDRQGATVHCVRHHAPLTRFSYFLFQEFLEEIYSRFWTSFMNLIVVQCPASTLHPQLHHPPGKFCSKCSDLVLSFANFDHTFTFLSHLKKLVVILNHLPQKVEILKNIFET